MTSQATSENLCACGCGTVITPGAKWARGHFHRGEGTWTPLPGPGEIPPDIDELVPGEARQGWDGAELGGPGAELGGQGDELGADPGPASLRDAPAGPRPSRPKLTSALRRDINAKVSMPLEMGGQMWRARDPVCGGMFVEQRPAIADALTDIICQSAELIEFFTGPAGGFMVYLKLAAAFWPVVELVLAHHIFGHGHGQADAPAGPQPDLSRYAA